MNTTDFDELRSFAMEAYRLSPYLAYRPILLPGGELDRAVDAFIEQEADEFCWSPCQTPDFLAQLVRAGFLSITTPLAPRPSEKHLLLPKLHFERCVIEPVQAVKISRSHRKQAKHYRFTVNRSFDEVAEACVRQHGYNWLGYVRSTLAELHAQPRRGVSCISIEIWNQDDQLVAGELGTIVGAMYTSMTGFSEESGAGSVQLVALGAYLYLQGFRVWDLGMGMPYKMQFGARELPRAEFVQLVRRWRDQPVDFDQRCDRNARELVDEMRARLVEAAQSAPKAAEAHADAQAPPPTMASS